MVSILRPVRKTPVAVDPEYFFGDYWGKTEPAVIDGTYIKLREISYRL